MLTSKHDLNRPRSTPYLAEYSITYRNIPRWHVSRYSEGPSFVLSTRIGESRPLLQYLNSQRTLQNYTSNATSSNVWLG